MYRLIYQLDGDHAARWIAALFMVLLVATLLPKGATLAQERARVTDAAARVLSATGDAVPVEMWLYFEESARTAEPIRFSERALRRRAKVDPVNLLRNERDFPTRPSILESVRAGGLDVLRQSRWLNAAVVRGTPPQLRAVQMSPHVRRIDITRQLSAPLPAPGERIDRQGPSRGPRALDYGSATTQNEFLHAAKLHDAGLSGRGVLIALFDSGFEWGLTVFDSTSIVATYDFIDGDPDVTGADCPEDPASWQQDYHGTTVLGCIGAYDPGNLIGTAYGADYALAKTEITCGDSETKIEEYNWIAAAEWADSIGADIISTSLGYTMFTDSGGYTTSQLDGNTALITQAADIAASKNILVVASAGNYRLLPWGTISFPADGDSVLAVGAVDSEGRLASFSSPGPSADGRIKPDVSTQGVDVRTVAPTGGLQSGGGTSYSAPLAAAAAALALEHDSTMTAHEIFSSLRRTARKSGPPDNNFGYGLIDAARAAEIITLDSIGEIRVLVGATVDAEITTSGRSDVEAALRLGGSVPDGVQFVDLGGGSGSLTVTGLVENVGARELLLIADVGYFVDSFYLSFNTFLDLGRPVAAGPNPFSDSVRIFFDEDAGAFQSVSIFNSAGELVWEQVNNSAPVTDVIVWYGRNSSGAQVAAGVYLAYIRTDRLTETIKLLKY